MDIEDLRNFGEEYTACSWYTSRALAGTSQLILCPYNYIFDPSIREAVISSSLENAVVIVDEAHNVEQVLLGKLVRLDPEESRKAQGSDVVQIDAGSTEGTMFDFMTISKDLCVIHR